MKKRIITLVLVICLCFIGNPSSYVHAENSIGTVDTFILEKSVSMLDEGLK